MDEQGAPPGWYPHPQMAGTVRYWNGVVFTGHTAPMPGHPAAMRVDDTWRTVGWICTFVFPIAGFVIGCLCISKGQKSDGWGMIAISAMISVFALAALAEAARGPY